MSENLLLALLLLLFGAVCGVLLTLMIDGRYWQRRLQAASAQRQQLQKEIRSLAQRLVRQQRDLAHWQSQVIATRQQLQAKTAELTRIEQALAVNQQAIEQLTHQWQQTEKARQAQAQTILNLRDEREQQQQAYHQLEKEQIRAEVRHEAACQQLSRLERDLRQAERRLEEKQQQALRLAELERDKANLLERLSQKREINQKLQNSPSQLEAVNGIGPTYARRLREGGILSLHDLAAADVEALRKIVKLQPWHGRDPQTWIDEARRLVS